MIKSLKDARITDGIPGILSKQNWTQALAGALGAAHMKTLSYADASQIYTAIDTAPEVILDALAVNWKIEWYDTGYSLERKRQIIKSAMEVRRLMGTTHATKLQADSIYPGTQLEEWFEYNGEPGTFRLYIDVSYSSEENPVEASDASEMEERLTTAKRWSAHMESLSYMVRRGIEIGKKVEGFTCEPPRCGMILCGTYPYIATVGWSDGTTIQNGAKVDGYDVTPPLCGTVPDEATAGYSSDVTIAASGEAAGFEADVTLCGEAECGTVPDDATTGASIETTFAAAAEAAGYETDPTLCGTTPEESTAGISIASSLDEGGEAEGYEVVSSVCGTSACGTLP